MSAFNIIRAAADDVHALAEISRATFIETFAADNSPADMELYLAENFTVEKLDAELSNENENFFFFIKPDSEIAGYLKLGLSGLPKENPLACQLEIERIYVLKKYHGKKIGLTLMEHAVAFARQHGFNSICLGVWENNFRAISFYESWGFEKYGSHIFKLGNDPQTDILMKKDISKL